MKKSGSGRRDHSKASIKKENAVLTQAYEKMTQSYEKKWVIIA